MNKVYVRSYKRHEVPSATAIRRKFETARLYGGALNQPAAIASCSVSKQRSPFD